MSRENDQKETEKTIKVKVETYEVNLNWLDLEKLIKHLEQNHLAIVFKIHVIKADYFEV